MLESQLLRAQRMESMGTLAGGIAHDLNNMLTPIMMSLRMLKEKYKDEQSQKLLTILEQNSQRSADLIRQVLSFSRDVEGEHAPLAVKHLITDIEKDEDSVREVTVSTWNEYGYKVLTASDGADVIALYAQNKDKIKVFLWI